MYKVTYAMMCCDKIYISITCQVVVYRIQIETIASPCLTQFILLSSTKKLKQPPHAIFIEHIEISEFACTEGWALDL